MGRIEPRGVAAQGAVVAAHRAPVAPAVQHLAAEARTTPTRAPGRGVCPDRLLGGLEVQAHIGADRVEIGRREVEVDQQAGRLGDQGRVLAQEFLDLRPEPASGMGPAQRGPVVVQGLARLAAEFPQVRLQVDEGHRGAFECLSVGAAVRANQHQIGTHRSQCPTLRPRIRRIRRGAATGPRKHSTATTAVAAVTRARAPSADLQAISALS